MRRFAGVVLVLAAAFAAPATAQQVELNLVTGAASGTDAAFGRDIAAIGATCGLELNVRESVGSLENVFAVRDRPVTQLGFVQSDVLEYLRTYEAEDETLRRAAGELRIALPLYEAEVHLLARREIVDLAGLAGRRVSIGAADSGSELTAQLVLDLAEVAAVERVPGLAPDAALDALDAGEIDALFLVSGAPAPLFGGDAVDGERFHLVPLTDPSLTAVYSPGVVPGGTYPFQPDDVAVVAVQTLLVTFEYVPGRNAYHRASCTGVSDVVHLVLLRLDALKAVGHPKWRAVDPTALPPGWSVWGCVLAALEPDYSFTCRRPDGSVEVEGGGAVSGDPNAVYLRRLCARIGC
jgi:TRAP transporter TAXI family solute receptor